MDSRVAYVNIWALINDPLFTPASQPAPPPRPLPTHFDYSRKLVANIIRNHVKVGRLHGVYREISHITFEFEDERAELLSFATFDGTGPHGTGVRRFAMPGHKLSILQKALALLTYIDFLISEGALNASWEHMVSKVQTEFDGIAFNGGASDIHAQYEALTAKSRQYVARVTRESIKSATAGE